jgi:hypothetical protein
MGSALGWRFFCAAFREFGVLCQDRHLKQVGFQLIGEGSSILIQLWFALVKETDVPFKTFTLLRT